MRERLGADGAEVLRQEVLADQAVATARARLDVSTSACVSMDAASTGVPERAGEWFDARSHGLEMLSKQALLVAYNHTFCTCLGRKPRKRVRSAASLVKKIRRALATLEGRRVRISSEGQVALASSTASLPSLASITS